MSAKIYKYVIIHKVDGLKIDKIGGDVSPTSSHLTPPIFHPPPQTKNISPTNTQISRHWIRVPANLILNLFDETIYHPTSLKSPTIRSGKECLPAFLYSITIKLGR